MSINTHVPRGPAQAFPFSVRDVLLPAREISVIHDYSLRLLTSLDLDIASPCQSQPHVLCWPSLSQADR